MIPSSSITNFWRASDAVRAAHRAIKKHDDGKLLTCHCGDCQRFQTRRTATPGVGYCDNHWPPGATIEPPHVKELREFNALFYP